MTAKVDAFILMKQHGLTSQGWMIDFCKAQRRLGLCSYREKKIVLSLDFVLLNEWEDVKDTVLHEVAHALCPGCSHNWIWKNKCREIGANPERLADGEKINTPEAPYIAICACGQKHTVYRKGKYFYKYLCRRCRSPLVFVENTKCYA